MMNSQDLLNLLEQLTDKSMAIENKFKEQVEGVNLKLEMLDVELVARQERHVKELKSKNLEIQTLKEQHIKELIDKNMEILMLKAKLAASQEESTKKSMKLQEQHVKELNDKNLVIQELEARLSAADQRTDDKLKVLKEQHGKQIKSKDLEVQSLQEKLKADQEQHAKELNEKDLALQDLTTRLSAEQQTVDKIMEITNQSNQLSRSIQMMGEQRLQDVYKAQEALRQKKNLIQEGGEMNENVMAKDPELEAYMANLMAELEKGRDGQSK